MTSSIMVFKGVGTATMQQVPVAREICVPQNKWVVDDVSKTCAGDKAIIEWTVGK